MRALRNPLAGTVVVAAGLIVGGFAAIWQGWHGAATTLGVAEQVTYLASGGIAGMAAMATGAVVLAVQRMRRVEAAERDVLERLATSLAELGNR